MTPKISFVALALVVLALIPMSAAPLPQGNAGIAARYPADAGIASDPAVIFADDFETYSNPSGLTSKWTQAFQMANMRIATESGNIYSGAKALEFTVPQTSSEVSNNVVKAVNPELDVLFLRYYSKYDSGWNVVGSSHNGSWISSRYCCPGVRADGYNKFLVAFETYRRTDISMANPGEYYAYVYHPDQRGPYGDNFYPNGQVAPYSPTPFDFGPEFVPRPNVIPQLGRWYSHELMVKTNTPGLKDGRIAMWLDGVLIADFMNLRFRETTSLKIDTFVLSLHVGSNTLAVTKKWYDNVVAATSYIGPISTATAPPRAPTNLRVIS